MKKENTDLSRRNFLAKGTAAAVAGASIIAIPASSPMNVSGATAPAPMLTNDPVYTDSAQTLTNKTIPSRQNTLGTDYVNIKEYAISGTDITNALNSALSLLGTYPYGGQILIPHGVWYSNGNHNIPNGVSVEGVGFNASYGWGGTEVKMNSGSTAAYMFGIKAYGRNISLRNMSINLNDKMTATGVLMTDIGTSGNFIYNTHIENFGIFGGEYGIKVDSYTNPQNNQSSQFECILNRFERISFIGCRTGFYCNTVNSGFTFDTCHFSVPTSGGSYSTSGTAVNCYVVGNISFDHCLFVGAGAGPLVPVTDGSTILRTTGIFNNISFYDCQDEGLQYAYQNASNAWTAVSLVYRNCLIQSSFKFTASGNVTMDSCRCAGNIYDSSSAYVRLYLQGCWNFYGYNTTTQQQNVIETPESHVVFTNASSQIAYDKLRVKPTIQSLSDRISGYYITYNRIGAVEVPSTIDYVQVYSSDVRVDSVVLCQIRSYNSGGVRIRDVISYSGYFVIALTQAPASTLSVGYLIEG